MRRMPLAGMMLLKSCCLQLFQLLRLFQFPKLLNECSFRFGVAISHRRRAARCAQNWRALTPCVFKVYFPVLAPCFHATARRRFKDKFILPLWFLTRFRSASRFLRRSSIKSSSFGFIAHHGTRKNPPASKRSSPSYRKRRSQNHSFSILVGFC